MNKENYIRYRRRIKPTTQGECRGRNGTRIWITTLALTAILSTTLPLPVSLSLSISLSVWVYYFFDSFSSIRVVLGPDSMRIQFLPALGKTVDQFGRLEIKNYSINERLAVEIKFKLYRWWTIPRFFFKQIEYHLTGGMRNCGGDGPNRWIFNISRAIAEIEFKFRVETRFISAFFGVFVFCFCFCFCFFLAPGASSFDERRRIVSLISVLFVTRERRRRRRRRRGRGRRRGRRRKKNPKKKTTKINDRPRP